MKQIPDWLKWLGWPLLILALFLFKTCESETKIITVIVPEKNGKFEPQKPTHTIVHDTIYKKGQTVTKENPLNKELAYENDILRDQFHIADSINKVLLYDRAIQINKFSTTFDNDDLFLTVEGIVRGEVQEITPSYKIKEQKVEVPVKVKQSVFALRAGAEIGSNKNFDQFIYKGNLFLNNYSISVDSKENFYVGYNFRIFDIKK